MAKKHKITNPNPHRNQIDMEHSGGLHGEDMLGAHPTCNGCQDPLDWRLGKEGSGAYAQAFAAQMFGSGDPTNASAYAKHAKTDDNGQPLVPEMGK